MARMNGPGFSWPSMSRGICRSACRHPDQLGRRTVHEIWSQLIAQLADDAPTQGEVIRLLAQLHAMDLIQADIAPDAAELGQRSTKHTRVRFCRNVGNPMAIGFPLWDPDRFLSNSIQHVAWVFSWLGASLWLSATLFGILLAAMHWSELTNNFSDRVFAVENLVLAALIFPILKLAHELGHGYLTKIAGGEVHELGVMFLVLAPVPYVDASASTALKSKW